MKSIPFWYRNPTAAAHHVTLRTPTLSIITTMRDSLFCESQHRITEIPEQMMSSICWVQITIYSGSSHLLSTDFQSSLFHCSSPFLKLPFHLLRSGTVHHNVVCKQHTSRKLFFNSPAQHIQYHAKQVRTR